MRKTKYMIKWSLKCSYNNGAVGGGRVWGAEPDSFENYNFNIIFFLPWGGDFLFRLVFPVQYFFTIQDCFCRSQWRYDIERSYELFIITALIWSAMCVRHYGGQYCRCVSIELLHVLHKCHILQKAFMNIVNYFTIT